MRVNGRIGDKSEFVFQTIRHIDEDEIRHRACGDWRRINVERCFARRDFKRAHLIPETVTGLQFYERVNARA